jgi:hypothetical protein
VTSPHPHSHLLQRGQGTRSPLFIDDRTGRPPLPVRSFEKIDEVDAERLFGLAHLPILKRVALQSFAESSYLIRQGFVRGGAREEAPYPTNGVGRGGRSYLLGREQEFAELLQGRFELTHGSPRPHRGKRLATPTGERRRDRGQGFDADSSPLDTRRVVCRQRLV